MGKKRTTEEEGPKLYLGKEKEHAKKKPEGKGLGGLNNHVSEAEGAV